jgi:serine/threonine protein kinase
MMGTLEYMSPEMLLKCPASQASDVYALAVTINEIATGKGQQLGTCGLRGACRATGEQNLGFKRGGLVWGCESCCVHSIPVLWYCLLSCTEVQKFCKYSGNVKALRCSNMYTIGIKSHI